MTETETESRIKTRAWDYFVASCILFGAIGTIALIMGVIALMIFTVLALFDSSNKEIQEVCSDNNLWFYLILSFCSWVFVFCTINTIDERPKVNDSAAKSVISNNYYFSYIGIIFAVNLALCVWGHNNLNTNCINENFHGSKIWLAAKMFWWIQIIITVVISFLILGTVMVFAFHNKKETTQKKTTQKKTTKSAPKLTINTQV